MRLVKNTKKYRDQVQATMQAGCSASKSNNDNKLTGFLRTQLGKYLQASSVGAKFV